MKGIPKHIDIDDRDPADRIADELAAGLKALAAAIMEQAKASGREIKIELPKGDKRPTAWNLEFKRDHRGLIESPIRLKAV